MEGPVHEQGALPLHRSEALTDGIFAVAMTLLVIDLKVPEQSAVHSAAALAGALADLLPKAISWALSFFVLAMFWIGHHRAYAHLRRTDNTLLGLNLLQLAFVSLMPFSSALSGEYGTTVLSQAVFSANMAILGVSALCVLRYVHRHPELGSAPMPLARYRGARLRIGGLIVISTVAVALAPILPRPSMGNIAFLLMAVVMPASRVLERRGMTSGDAEPSAAAH
jgi:uncharacterized membrane protein